MSTASGIGQGSTMRKQNPPKTSGKVLLGLQVLRAVAALLVLITHAGFYASERLIKGYQYWNRGAVGVDIFFTLSGFVMIHSSQALFSDPNGWKIFAERRVIRIVPLYWIVTSLKLATMVAGAHAVLHADLNLNKAVCSYLFIPSWNVDHELRPVLGVGWTLNFEMFFYVMFCIGLAARLNVIKFLSILFGLLAMGSYFRSQNGPAIIFYLNPIVLNFIYGMVIAKIYQLIKKPMDWRIATFALVAGFALILSPVRVEWLGLAAGIIVWATISLEPGLQWLPKWALFLGDASYAIYLCHPMIAPLAPTLLAKAHLPKIWLSVILSLILGVGGGAIVHKFVELPVTAFFRARIRFRGKPVIHLPETTSFNR